MWLMSELQLSACRSLGTNQFSYAPGQACFNG
jgi:hypothetical protein